MTDTAVDLIREWGRFEDKFIPEPNSGCWLWIGGVKGRMEYGAFSFKGRGMMAHRFAYEALIGPVPDGLVLDHTCRVPTCVNPDHLRPVTQTKNILIGESFSAKNAAKTHCPRGHPLSGRNLTIRHNRNRNPYRECRTCEDRRLKQRYL